MLFKRVLVVVGSITLASLFLVSILPPTTTLMVLSVAVGLLFLCTLKVGKAHRATLVLAITVAILGILSYHIISRYYAHPIRQLDGKTAVVDATVLDVIKDEGASSAYLLKITSHTLMGVPKKFKVKLYSPVSLDVDYYDKITAEIKFSAITSTPLFDAVTYYQTNDINIFAFLGSMKQKTTPEFKPPISAIRKLNDKLCSMIDLNMDAQAAGIVKAMLLGNTDGISDLTMYQFSMTGIIHVVSVSGLHVSLVAGAISLLVRLITTNKKARNVVCVVFVWIFVALTGAHISAIRCALMFTIINISALFFRKSDGLTSLFFAAIVIVGANPFAISDMGFQLSFLATLGIFICGTPLSKYIVKRFLLRHRVTKMLVSATAVSASATLFCLPILIMLTKGTNPLMLVVNIVAIPVTTIILFGGALALACCAIIPSFAHYVTGAVEFIVTVLVNVTAFFARSEEFFLGLDYPIVLLFVVVIGAAVGLALLWAPKMVTEVMLAGAIFLTSLPLYYMVNNRDLVEFYTFNSYEGSVIVVIDGGEASVVSIFSDGYIGNNVSKFLAGKDIQRVNFLVLQNELSQKYSDTLFLHETKRIDDVFAMPQSDIVEAIDVNELYGFEYQNAKTVINSSSVTYKAFEKDIVITADRNVAQNTDCEFLFFYPNDEKELEHFAAKYVILVGECDWEIKKNMYDATQEAVAVSISENGASARVL